MGSCQEESFQIFRDLLIGLNSFWVFEAFRDWVNEDLLVGLKQFLVYMLSEVQISNLLQPEYWIPTYLKDASFQ